MYYYSQLNYKFIIIKTKDRKDKLHTYLYIVMSSQYSITITYSIYIIVITPRPLTKTKINYKTRILHHKIKINGFGVQTPQSYCTSKYLDLVRPLLIPQSLRIRMFCFIPPNKLMTKAKRKE